MLALGLVDLKLWSLTPDEARIRLIDKVDHRLV